MCTCLCTALCSKPRFEVARSNKNLYSPLLPRGVEIIESADKPGSVVNRHSSRPAITHRLKQPTRFQYGPYLRKPIWSCFGWSLPCTKLLLAGRCALTAPFHPYRFETYNKVNNKLRRFPLCCTCR